MSKRYTLKQSLYVRASMFTADELRRQDRLGLKEIDEGLFEGLISQRTKLETQQNNLLRSFAASLFLAFIAWSGGSIQIPGTGASIADIPAFLELSLLTAALCVLMTSYTFLSIQLYNALIETVAGHVLAKNKLDPDLFSAAHSPTLLFFKYCRVAPVVGRLPGFKISSFGATFYGVVVGLSAVILLTVWFLAVASILYIAHSGLSDDIFGWAVYASCAAMTFVSFISMLANVLEFTHEMDFSILEEIVSDDSDLQS